MIKKAYVLGKLHSGGKKNLVMEFYRHMETDKVRIDFIYNSGSNYIPMIPAKHTGRGVGFVNVFCLSSLCLKKERRMAA